MSTVLFATVGGSHQPIVTAIREGRPERVVFFCTDRDPATGRSGSRAQIEGKGACIRAAASDEIPTLPNIPAQCGLADQQWELRVVPADDMDGAFSVMRAAIAAWDRFDHVGAAALLDLYASVAAPRLGAWYAPLRVLAGIDSARRTGLLIWDLWLNALRRAGDGRHDDAVARVYRVIEWTAQWLLEMRCELRTADLPAGVAAAAGIAPGRDGRFQAGLWAAWQLVAERAGGAGADFIRSQSHAMLDHLKRRNGSILAHGFAPVGAAEWKSLQSWFEAGFVPMLEAELRAAGLREQFAQLPHRYPWQ